MRRACSQPPASLWAVERYSWTHSRAAPPSPPCAHALRASCERSCPTPSCTTTPLRPPLPLWRPRLLPLSQPQSEPSPPPLAAPPAWRRCRGGSWRRRWRHCRRRRAANKRRLALDSSLKSVWAIWLIRNRLFVMGLLVPGGSEGRVGAAVTRAFGGNQQRRVCRCLRRAFPLHACSRHPDGNMGVSSHGLWVRGTPADSVWGIQRLATTTGAAFSVDRCTSNALVYGSLVRPRLPAAARHGGRCGTELLSSLRVLWPGVGGEGLC
jgi:hypothetical protein